MSFIDALQIFELTCLRNSHQKSFYENDALKQ